MMGRATNHRQSRYAFGPVGLCRRGGVWAQPDFPNRRGMRADALRALFYGCVFFGLGILPAVPLSGSRWHAVADAPRTVADRFVVDFHTRFHLELTADSPMGAASIREHAIAWHPERQKYYLIADVVPLASPHHPNTYNTQLHLWSSPDLKTWQYHGVAVEKGRAGHSYYGYGVASPAGMVYFDKRLLVAFSGRRTPRFDHRSIGLAISGPDPELLPWQTTEKPISDLTGEDDDPALLVLPDGETDGRRRLHLYHRRTGPHGYRIVHTQSSAPEQPESWPPAVAVVPRPDQVRAQELTGAFAWQGKPHLLVIEHLHSGAIRIAHLVAQSPEGPFHPAVPGRRYLSANEQPRHLAYSGHITPVMREQRLVACFWTVAQQGRRYGLLGHPARLVTRSVKPPSRN